jgi:hypothetical protein
MSFRTELCVVVACDGCPDPWDDQDGVPHFSTEAEAIEVVRSLGWVVVGRRVLCNSCVAKEVCAATGHVWLEWQQLEMEGVRWRSRHCENCSDSESDPPREALFTLLDAAKVLNGLDGHGE